MAKTVGSREARNDFSHLIGEVHFGGQVVIVERSGRPMVAIIPFSDYQRLVAEREARFQILDEIRDQIPTLPVEEVERDIAEALAAARIDTEASDATSRP
jgi:prevent-host-death family protein